MKRFKMNRRSSKKYFSRTAGNGHVHKKNLLNGGSTVMRGGIRL